MKKIIILLLAFLLSGCSAVKPAETLSSMQTEPTASETTVADTPVTVVAEETIPMEVETEAPTFETVVAVQKEDSSAPSVEERSEQKPAQETTATASETPAETVKADALAEPPKESETPPETAKVEMPAEIPPTVETPPESVSEPPKAEFDINYWVRLCKILRTSNRA